MWMCHFHRASVQHPRPGFHPRLEPEIAESRSVPVRRGATITRHLAAEAAVWALDVWIGVLARDATDACWRCRAGAVNIRAPPVAAERTNHSSARDLFFFPIGRTACQSDLYAIT